MKSEYGLKPTVCRQLYWSCTFLFRIIVQKFGENGQQKYEKLFQNLQNRMIRKILGTCKTTPVQAMEIESHIHSTSHTTIIDEKSKICHSIVEDCRK